MIQVVILGFGNVGSHLLDAFQATSAIEVVQVYSRSLPTSNEHERVSFIQDLSEVKKADVYLVAVPDDAIPEVTTQLPFKNRLVAHTSGGATIEAINEHQRRAVFYPLQSFSKHTAVDYRSVPICIEAEHKDDEQLLQKVGSSISDKVVGVSSEDRAQLHLAAVYVNNFVNHLYHISEGILAEKNLDFDLLKPLILETARKVQYITPSEAQTGPALRNDANTIKKHVALLEDEELKELYAFFTKAIQQ